MSKFGNIKVNVDGFKFDSKVECNYYLDLKLMVEAGVVESFDLQPKFEILPKYKRGTKTIRATHYIADFKVVYTDGHVEIIDVKGMATDTAKLKRKMFEFKYPDLKLRWINKSIKYGDSYGWADVEHIEAMRKQNKKK